jgi:hypothetical protein
MPRKLSESELIVWAMRKSNRGGRATATLLGVTIKRVQAIRSKFDRNLKKCLQEGGSEEGFIIPSLPLWGCSSIEELLDKARGLVLPPPPQPETPWPETEEGRKWAEQQAANTEKIQAEIGAQRIQALLPTIFDTTGNKLNFRKEG